MDRRGFIISSCAVLLSPTETFSETFAAKETLARLHANVIFLRYALAPGFGDPDNFRLDDCDTQRNLSAAGRDQAVAIGQNMTRAGLVFDAVYSSQWCRCLETAELLGLGKVQAFAGLNSFFQGHAQRSQTLPALQAKLAGLPVDGLSLMVTHQVVIQAITRLGVGSGEAVALNTTTGHAEALALG